MGWAYNMSISIHSPRAGGDQAQGDHARSEPISIHSPRAGGDQVPTCRKPLPSRFQSTPPVRGETFVEIFHLFLKGFQSTPPVRGETRTQRQHILSRCNFNPLPPCGGRRAGSSRSSTPRRFQSTPPVRGETRWRRILCAATAISIHSPRAGGDADGNVYNGKGYKISIHSPRAGGDRIPACQRLHLQISIHSPRAGGDPGRV